MLSYYVMDKLGYMKGVPGIFVACLFSGTMRWESWTDSKLNKNFIEEITEYFDVRFCV